MASRLKPRAPEKFHDSDDEDFKIPKGSSVKKSGTPPVKVDHVKLSKRIKEAETTIRGIIKKAERAEKPKAPKTSAPFGMGDEDRVGEVDFERGLKRTKKEEKLMEDWTGDRRGRSIDALFQAVVEDGRKKFGAEGVMLGSDTYKLVGSIPMFGGHGPLAAKYPGCLPMEWTMGQDGFLLSLIYQFVAKHGVGKSAFLAEIFRMFSLAGGGGELIEAEAEKFNPLWYRSILHDMYDRRVIYRHADSVEGWQRHLTNAAKFQKARMLGTADEPGPGRTVPVCFGVDSIMGTSSEETQEKILGSKGKKGGRGKTGEGAASRGFPIEAMVITRYLRTFPNELRGWPFAVVLINHLKMKQDDQGNPERAKAGGEQVNFQEAFELELRKVGGPKKLIRHSTFQGYPVMISNEKNSFGVGQRNAQVRLVWDYKRNQDDGTWEQHTIWDWDWGTVQLLFTLLTSDKSDPMVKQNLKDMGFHLDCPQVSDIENKAWSKTLGMKSKDALSWTEVGAMIREDRKLMKQLRDAMHIVRRPRLKGDYLQQLSKLATEMP